MVASKRRHVGALLAAFVLVLSFFGLTQVLSAPVPARADTPSCPAAVTNVSWTGIRLSWLTTPDTRSTRSETGGTWASSSRGRRRGV